MSFSTFKQLITKSPLSRVALSNCDEFSSSGHFLFGKLVMSLRPKRRQAYLTLLLTAFLLGTEGIKVKESYQPAIAQTVPSGASCPTLGGTIGLNELTSEFSGSFGTLNSGYRDLQNPPVGYSYRNSSVVFGSDFGLAPGQVANVNGISVFSNTPIGVLYESAVYTVTSQVDSGQDLNIFGPWRAQTGVNTGTATDAYLAVNGDTAVGVFMEETVTVSPNTNYELGLFAMNVHGASSPYGGSGEEPNVGIEAIGIRNGVQTPLATTETGLLPKGGNWQLTSLLFNSGDYDSVILRARNITTQAVGNDFYLDGVFAAECNNLPAGDITGTVFADVNSNGSQEAGEPGISGVTLTLTDANGVPVSITSGADGTYTFSDIADVAALEAYSVTVDTTSTPVNGLGTTTSTQTTGINVVASSSVAGGNYGFNAPVDFGDAPDSYGTDLTVSGGEPAGAVHLIESGLHLGTAPDAETDASPPLDGSGDGAEDNGITLTTLTEGDTSYTIPAANITATGTGTLHAWIDFDKSGTFEPGEHTSIEVASGTPAGDLSWSGITAGAAGDTYARFRFTSDTSINANTPGGAASDGEVEDYQVAIQPISTNPNVVLVERITAINGNRTQNPNDNTLLNDVVNDSVANSADDQSNWPASYLVGAIDGGLLQPGDKIERTVYFLNTGINHAASVRICDWIQPYESFLTGVYAGNDIELVVNGTTYQLTAASDAADRAELATLGSLPAGPTCNLPAAATNATDEVLVLDITGTTGDPTGLTTLPGTTGQGTPINAYGFFRFTTKVDE